MRSVNSSSEALERFNSTLLPAMPLSQLAELHGQVTAFLKQRNVDLARQNHAAECRLRIERQLGALLTETVVPRGNHGGVIGATKSLPEGITKKQSFRWRREAAVPEAEFERWVAETLAAGGELTSAGLLALWTELNDEAVKSTRVVDLIFSRTQIIDSAFAHYRRTGFPYRNVPLHVAMQDLNRLAVITASKLLTTTVGCVVADSYHPHRFHANRDNHSSAVEIFNSDKHLRRALEHELLAGRSIPSGFFSGLTIVSGTAPCSNFRPGVASHYYRRFCPAGGVVLDTCAGYGGRLVGFLASRTGGSYVGIDPNVDTHNGNLRLAADLGFADTVELHCSPVEDLAIDTIRGRCDFSLTSPPYFTKEHYSDDATQSWRRYSTPHSWREGFLRPMLQLQYQALKVGAYNVINVDDVRINNKSHAVTEWTTSIANEVGFELVDVEQLVLPAPFWMQVHDLDPSEPIFIFRKPRTVS